MSTEQPPPVADDSPEAELAALYDDPDDPSEVTLVPVDPPPERYLTEWVTADAGTAVSLVGMR